MTRQHKTPALIAWCGYLAIALLVALPLSVLAVRSGAWQQGLLLYALASLGSMALLIVFIVLLLLPRFAGYRARIGGRALLTLPGALAVLALTLTGGDAPRIHDITTDTSDPPIFVTAAAKRGAGANTLDIKPEVIEQQKAAYPDLGTLHTSLDADAAYMRALQVAQELGWEIYHEDRTGGVIEAVDTTPIMGFKDDVVIRVSSAADGTQVDLRSVSRIGQGDIGANAERIRRFTKAFRRGAQ